MRLSATDSLLAAVVALRKAPAVPATRVHPRVLARVGLDSRLLLTNALRRSPAAQDRLRCCMQTMERH